MQVANGCWYDHSRFACQLWLRTQSQARNSKGPLILSASVCVCVFGNDRSNSNKTQTQKMGSIPVLCINVSITIDTMLKFDANVNIDVSVNSFQLKRLGSTSRVIFSGGFCLLASSVWSCSKEALCPRGALWDRTPYRKRNKTRPCDRASCNHIWRTS